MPDAAAVMGYRLCEVEQALHVLPSLRASGKYSQKCFFSTVILFHGNFIY
jgi:hypothetical protein